METSVPLEIRSQTRLDRLEADLRLRLSKPSCLPERFAASLRAPPLSREQGHLVTQSDQLSRNI
jgi:hypothetical protein